MASEADTSPAREASPVTYAFARQKGVAYRPGAEPAFLLQGTLYPDVIESISYKGPSATIKTHAPHASQALVQQAEAKDVFAA